MAYTLTSTSENAGVVTCRFHMAGGQPSGPYGDISVAPDQADPPGAPIVTLHAYNGSVHLLLTCNSFHSALYFLESGWRSSAGILSKEVVP